MFIRLIASFALFAISACEDLSINRDPLDGPFPYNVHSEKRIHPNDIFIDLDHDGRDECLRIQNANGKNPSEKSRLRISDHDWGLVEEVPFVGRLYRPRTFDWTGNGIDEIAVCYTLHDTARLRLMDYKGAVLKETALFVGNPRVDSTGVHEWSGAVEHLSYIDLENDGRKELVVVAAEGYAQAPRGVFVYEGESLALKWKYEIGPRPQPPVIADIDNDKQTEILLPANAPNNGHQANQTSDDRCYVFLFDANGTLLWQREYGRSFSSVWVQFEDLEGDGEAEIIVLAVESSTRTSEAIIEVLNPEKGNTIRYRKLRIDGGALTVLQMDRNADKEIIIYDQAGKILMFNDRLELVRSVDIPVKQGYLSTAEDLDYDGLKEIFAQGLGGTVWLDENLAIQASYSKGVKTIYDHVHAYHTPDSAPLVAFVGQDDAELVAFRKNTWYRVAYYGPRVALLLTALVAFGLVYNTARFYSTKRHLTRLAEVTCALHPNPTLILDHRLRLIFTNEAAEPFLTNDRAIDPKSRLGQEITRLLQGPPMRRLFTIHRGDNGEKKLQIVAEPILHGNFKRPNWLVQIQRQSAEIEAEKNRAWAAMARKIAHDINNPLTTILLKLQRLQMEYRAHNDSHTKDYDRYVEQILERIESLRRMSRGFMKFLNLEKLNKQPTNINRFIEDLFSKSIIELPDDLALEKELAAHLPTVYVDREQLRTLFENIVSNAVNAMPDGGTISIKTEMASNLQFRESQEPRDYLLVEILDTGVGIPQEVMNNLYQPYTSTAASGTGLGLTIMKKIVDDHMGHIQINSDKGSGTCIALYLPVS